MHFSKLVAFCLFALTQTLIASAERPNILLICIDDLNTDVGVLGGPAFTPHIDKLAASSMLFTDAHCNAPVCNASRASFMTGLYPSTLGVYSNHPNFRDTEVGKNAVTIPQYFSKFGYHTVAAGKIFHNQRGSKNQPKPFSDPISWDIQAKNEHGVPYQMPNDARDLWHEGKLGTGYWPAKAFVWDSVDLPDEETYDWQNADYCADFLAQEHDKPFFLACGIFKPHVPFIAPQKYFDLYPLEDIELPPHLENDLDDVGPIGKDWAHKADLHKWITHFGQWEKAIQAYRACISYADACVGHVIDSLESSSYKDNTVVVLLSDHGFHLGDKEHWAKFTFWDYGTRVPFIIRAPGKTGATSYDQPVSLIDLYPTLVELAGLPTNAALEGQSLVPILELPTLQTQCPVKIEFQDPGNEARLTDEWLYIRYKDGFEELYDRKNDPHNFQNLATQSNSSQILDTIRSL